MQWIPTVLPILNKWQISTILDMQWIPTVSPNFKHVVDNHHIIQVLMCGGYPPYCQFLDMQWILSMTKSDRALHVTTVPVVCCHLPGHFFSHRVPTVLPILSKWWVPTILPIFNYVVDTDSISHFCINQIHIVQFEFGMDCGNLLCPSVWRSGGH